MTGGTLPAKAWLKAPCGWTAVVRKVLPLLELGLQVWPDDLPLTRVQRRGPGGPRQDGTGLKQIQAFVARHPDSGCPHELILLLVKAKRIR